MDGEAQLFEVPRVSRDIRRDVTPTGSASRLAPGKEAVMGVAHDVRMRAVRPPVPSPLRTRIVHHPAPPMLRRPRIHVSSLPAAIRFLNIRLNLGQRPPPRACGGEPDLEHVPAHAPPSIAIPEPMHAHLLSGGLVTESDRQPDVPCR